MKTITRLKRQYARLLRSFYRSPTMTKKRQLDFRLDVLEEKIKKIREAKVVKLKVSRGVNRKIMNLVNTRRGEMLSNLPTPEGLCIRYY